MTAQVDCYKLNIDLVTKFDPFFLEKIRGFESNCEDVLENMKNMLDSLQTRSEDTIQTHPIAQNETSA